jgi:hypothetical protein
MIKSRCGSTISQTIQNNNTLRSNVCQCCKQHKGSLVSQMFTQALLKEEKLWLAVVLEHFYITSATPLRLIGYLQTSLS